MAGSVAGKKNFASVSPCLVVGFYCRRLMDVDVDADGMEIIRKWQKLCQPSCHQTGRGSVWHSGDEARQPPLQLDHLSVVRQVQSSKRKRGYQ